jgi:hypothetical protein
MEGVGVSVRSGVAGLDGAGTKPNLESGVRRCKMGWSLTMHLSSCSELEPMTGSAVGSVFVLLDFDVTFDVGLGLGFGLGFVASGARGFTDWLFSTS